MSKVEEIYDHHIWKELEKDDAVPPEVNPLFDWGKKNYTFASFIQYSTFCNSLGLSECSGLVVAFGCERCS